MFVGRNPPADINVIDILKLLNNLTPEEDKRIKSNKVNFFLDRSCITWYNILIVIHNNSLSLTYSPPPLVKKVKIFFKRKGLILNWKEFEKLDEVQKINTLAMISPISNEEKQKLLESVSLEEKTLVLLDIVNFYLHGVDFNNQTLQ